MKDDLALGLVRVTEVAALECAKYLGRGDKISADQAAVDGMRRTFDSLDIEGTVVIGEGEMDEAPMLFIGERVGECNTSSLKVDIAVDPVDGTNLVARGLPNALSVVAIASEGCLLHAPDIYMEKIAVGPKAYGCVDLNAPIQHNIKSVARALDKKIEDITVIMLDRERHEHLIEGTREVGARIKLIQEGDIAAAIATGFEDTGVDMMVGIGGAPEGVIAAAALKCLGGDMQCKLRPSNDKEKERCHQMGIKDLNRIIYLDEMVKGDEVYFAATGVSDGDLLKGVVYQSNDRASTHSIVMKYKTGTIRIVNAVHNLNKKNL